MESTGFEADYDEMARDNDRELRSKAAAVVGPGLADDLSDIILEIRPTGTIVAQGITETNKSELLKVTRVAIRRSAAQRIKGLLHGDRSRYTIEQILP